MTCFIDFIKKNNPGEHGTDGYKGSNINKETNTQLIQLSFGRLRSEESDEYVTNCFTLGLCLRNMHDSGRS